jgi:hypothetical protein
MALAGIASGRGAGCGARWAGVAGACVGLAGAAALRRARLSAARIVMKPMP